MDDWTDLYRRLDTALRDNEEAAYRLSKARTTVSFCRDDDDPVVVLLLDRRPAEVASEGEAEVRVTLRGETADRFVRGEVVLSTAILEGDAAVEGPVRKYLNVDPILRGLMRAGGDA